MIFELLLFGTHTPAIATDLISDIMKIATEVLQFFYQSDAGLDGFANKKC
jgi:hypothetical protein